MMIRKRLYKPENIFMFQQEKLIRYQQRLLFLEQHDYSICLLFTEQENQVEIQFILFSSPSRNIIKRGTSDFDKWHFRLFEKLK